jgi:imidazolonepropionase
MYIHNQKSWEAASLMVSSGQTGFLLRNAHLATLDPAMKGLGEIAAGALAVEDGRIAFAGAEPDCPARLRDLESIDCKGRLVMPGLIDCHTHLVHAGNRANEFEMRLNGASYEDIARAGGGIVSSVKAVRTASEEELIAQSLPRLDALIGEGVTTVEIKSGYGLTNGDELKMLRAARALASLRPVAVSTTHLAAHATPAEYKGRNGDYIREVVLPSLEAAAREGLCDAVDGFCEKIAFSPAEIKTVFERARQLGLPVKLHADQLSDLGGAALAARFGALSADHLEHTGEEGVAAMAAAGTVAVILPGAFYFLRETRKPPIDLFRKHRVPMALATDCNPGTSPLTSLLLTMNMAATLFSMSVEECIAGVTREAARALGLSGETGMLKAGMRADIAIWNAVRPAELVYRIGFNPLYRRIFAGVPDANERTKP